MSYARTTSTATSDNYADNVPLPEPHDVRAHLHGGVPKREVAAHAEAFSRHGLDVTDLFVDRDADYWDFADLDVPIGDLIAANTADHELALRQEFERCWTDASRRIIDLANGGTSVGLRSDLIELFRSPLTEIGPLDRFQTAGVVARWWDEISFDMQTLETRGIAGVLDGWLTTAAAMQQDRNGSSLADQPLIGALAADLLRQREDAAASLAELDAAIEVVEATSDDEGGENTGVDSETLSHGELKSLKNHRTQLRKRLKKLDADLLDAARRARGALTTGGAEALVLVIFRQHLQSSIEKRLAGHREDLVATYRTWKRKYAVTLRSREEARETAIASVKRHLTELGYE